MRYNIVQSGMIAFLMLDYILSHWFSKTPETIVRGATFLFLNKIVFIWLFFMLLIGFFMQNSMDVRLWVFILVAGSLLIMYGLQKKIEKRIKSLSLRASYSKLTRKQVMLGRIKGLFLFVFSYILIFITAVLT